MGHFESIKAAIDAKVNTNGRQAISGHILNNILHGMLDAIDVALADEVQKILGDVPVEFDTLEEIADYIVTDKKQYAEVLEALNAINTSLTKKVDKTAFNLTIAELTQSIATKLDKTTYDAAMVSVTANLSALAKSIKDLTLLVGEIDDKVNALINQEPSDLVGYAVVGKAIIGASDYSSKVGKAKVGKSKVANN